MLIKMVDGKLMYDDIQSTEKTMEERCRIWETHEQGAIEMKQKIWQNVVESRRTIIILKKQRAEKVCDILAWWLKPTILVYLKVVSTGFSY